MANSTQNITTTGRIVVAENGIEGFVLNSSLDAQNAFTLSEDASQAIRKHVDAFVAASDKNLPYSDRLSAGTRVGLRSNNKMLPEIREIYRADRDNTNVTVDAPAIAAADKPATYLGDLRCKDARKSAEVWADAHIENDMRDAEKINASMAAADAPAPTNGLRKALLTELAKHGFKAVAIA